MNTVLIDPWLILDVSECEEGDATRFIPLFRKAWMSLPGLVTRVIRQYWTEGGACRPVKLYSFGRNSAGNVRAGGRDLRFNYDMFRIVPDEYALVPIVHELGHVLFLATGEELHRKAEQEPNTFQYTWSCELINLELVRRWGYRQDEFSEWLNCAVSNSGPFLRTTAGEPPLDPVKYREGVARLMGRWARERGIGAEEVEREHRRLLATKEPYYHMAVQGGAGYEDCLAQGVEHLGQLLREHET